MAGLNSTLKVAYDGSEVDAGLAGMRRQADRVNRGFTSMGIQGVNALANVASFGRDLLAPVFEKLKELAVDFAIEVREDSQKLQILSAQVAGLRDTAAAAIATGVDSVNMEQLNAGIARLTSKIVVPFELVGKAIALALVGETESVVKIFRVTGELAGEAFKLGAQKGLSETFVGAFAKFHEVGGKMMGRRPDEEGNFSEPSIVTATRTRGEVAEAQREIDFNEKLRTSLEELKIEIERLNDTVGRRDRAGSLAPGFESNNVFR